MLPPQSFQRLGKDHIGRKPPAAPAAPPAAAADGDADAAAAPDTAAAAGEGGSSAKAPSIADRLAAEVAELKQERVIRFRRHNTDVRGTFFVEFPKVEGEQGPTKREESCVCVCVCGGGGQGVEQPIQGYSEHS